MLLMKFYISNCKDQFGLDPKQDWVSAQQAQTINLQSVEKRTSLIIEKR